MKKILIAAAAVMCFMGTASFAMDISRSDINADISGTAAAESDVRLNVTSSDGELVWLDSILSDSGGNYSFTMSFPFEDETKEYIVSVNASDTQTVKIEGTNEIAKLFKACSENDFDSFVRTYAERFGLNYEEYQKINDKKTVYSIFKDCSGEVADSYYTALGIALINMSGRGEVLDALEKYSQYIAKDYGKDKESMSKSQLEKFAVALSSKDYYSLSDFSSAYKKALTDAKTPSTDNSRPASGNVSGGKGGAVNPPSPTQKPEDNQSDDEPFSDISDVSWAHDSIIRLYKNGIINGKGNGIFAPNDIVTREEFTVMLMRVSGMKSENGTTSFEDVLPDSWYAQSVCAAVENEIVFGISESKFGIGNRLTRQDCAAMCARLLKKYVKDTEISDEVFADDSDIADYAKQGVYILKKLGILSGTGENRFEPAGACTRAMTAKIIDLLSENLK